MVLILFYIFLSMNLYTYRKYLASYVLFQSRNSILIQKCWLLFGSIIVSILHLLQLSIIISNILYYTKKIIIFFYGTKSSIIFSLLYYTKKIIFFNNTKFWIIFSCYIIPKKNFSFNGTKYLIIFSLLYYTPQKNFF